MALLPGQTFSGGASNYVFGTNTPNYDTSLLTNSQIQSQMSTAGITVIRTALNSSSGVNYTDSQLDALYTAIHAAGAVMLAILPHNQSAFAQHVVSYLGSRCLMYEYANERDINGESWQTYLSEWNSIIPLCRTANPSAIFIGPVLGAFSNVNSYLVPWLKGCKSSGVLPDAVSVHIYPCTGGSIPQQTCLARASGIGASVAGLRSTVQGILGYSVPLCLTEWNADAYYNNSTSGNQAGQGYNSNAAANNTFNSQFAIQALEGFVANGVDMACHFELDYFLANKSGATSTAPQYLALASEKTKYFGGGGGTTVGTISTSPSTLAVSSHVNGATVLNTITVKNTGTASGTFSSPIAYGAYGNLNWVTVTSSTTTIAAGASQTVTVACTPQTGMPVGSYTAVITFAMGTSTSIVTVTLTIAAPINTSSHIYVPTNAYPTDPSGAGTTWAQYEAGSPAVSFIIANPASGPGASVDANFTAGITAMHTAGVKVLGYISSSNFTTVFTESAIKTQIDTWYSLYNIDGICLDIVLPTSGNYTTYQDLYNYIKTKDTVRNYVFLNAYQIPPESYLAICDTVNIYQDTLGNIGRFVAQAYMANYPASKFAATVTGVSNAATVDSTVAALQGANVGYIFVTDQTTNAYTTPPGTTVWNELIKDSNVGASTGGGGTGGSTGVTPLSVYFAAAASTTLTTANQLYSPSTAGSPATTWKYSRVGTASGYGEVTSQGTTSAWAAATTLPAPTGHGFLNDVTTLEGQQIVAGNWAAVVRLNCAQSGDTAPQAGSLTGDIIVRAYKYNGGTYTAIVTMTLGSQTIPSAFTSFTLPSTPASAMTFGTGDKLYIDTWLNVTANTNASSVQDIRVSRQSQDTTGHTGDPNATIGTPGYATAGTVTGGTGTTSASDTFTRANQSGFGTSSDGETWTLTSGPGTLSIVSNQGVIVSSGGDTNAQLGTNALTDVDIRCQITTNVTGDIAGVQGRYTVSTGVITCYKLVYANGFLLLNKCIAGTNTTLSSIAFAPTLNTVYNYHLRIQGTALYGNVYQSYEPSVWMVSATDSSITGAGGFAILANTGTSSTGIAFDNFSANAVTATSTTPALTVSPASLNLTATQGGGATVSQTVTLTTNASTSGAWASTTTYNNGYGWLALNVTSGTLTTSGTQLIAISANPAGLPPGTYSASLAFTCGTASQTVLVAFVVAASTVNSLPVSLTSVGRSLIGHGLTGADNPLIVYFALGTGTTSPSSGDTRLVNEIFRKTVTSAGDGVNPGEILINCYIAPNDVVGVSIAEVGVFGGNSASTNPGTGVLLARGLYQLSGKTNLESVQLVLDLQIQ